MSDYRENRQPKQYYAKISKTLSKYNLTWNDYKKYPHKLLLVDYSFLKYWMNTFKFDQDITWWTNPYNLSLHIDQQQIEQLVNEYATYDPDFARKLLDWFNDTCK